MKRYICNFSFSTSKLCYFLLVSRGYWWQKRKHLSNSFPLCNPLFSSSCFHAFVFQFEWHVCSPISFFQDIGCSASWICTFVFHQIWEGSTIIYSNIFSSPWFFSSLSGIPRTQILDSLKLCLFFHVFSLCCPVWTVSINLFSSSVTLLLPLCC